MRLNAENLASFYTHSKTVETAAENLPSIVTAESFQEANEYSQQEIHSLKESFFYMDDDGMSCEPIHIYIAEFLNDESVANKDVERMTKDILFSFMHLLKALNKFIRLKNTLPAKGYEQEKDTLEKSFSTLAECLGMMIEKLKNETKDAIDSWIYEGPSLNSVRGQMNTRFNDNTQTLRELLHLDKSADGSPRKKPVDKIKIANDAKKAADKKRKAKQKAARKNRRKK